MFWFWHSSDLVSRSLATANSNNSNSSTQHQQKCFILYSYRVTYSHTMVFSLLKLIRSFGLLSASEYLLLEKQPGAKLKPSTSSQPTWISCKCPGIITGLRSQKPLPFPLRDYFDTQKSFSCWSCKMKSDGSVWVWSFFKEDKNSTVSQFPSLCSKSLCEKVREKERKRDQCSNVF